MTETVKQPLRLMFLGLNYAPEPIGIGPYSAGLCEKLASWGHQVEAVVGMAYYPQWQRYPDQPKHGKRLVQNGVGVTRCRHYIPRKPSGLRRIAHLASFSLSAFLPSIKAARRLRPDAVLTVAPSLLAAPVAWAAARLSGAKLWVHIQDFEVEAAFATGLLETGGPVARIARNIENRLLALADCVSTISPQMLARLRDKGIPAKRCYELRNWTNAEFGPDTARAESFRAQWGIGERHVALYSGNIANKQGIEIAIKAARLLRERKDLVFVICGQGPNRAQLDELAAELTNVQLHDLQPAECMGGLLALASLHLLPQIPGAADLVLPSKLTNMLLSGRPIVATAAPGTGLAKEVEDCGTVTPPGDALAFAAAIAALINDPERRTALGRAAKQRAAERWDQEAILQQFVDRLRNLLGCVEE